MKPGDLITFSISFTSYWLYNFDPEARRMILGDTQVSTHTMGIVIQPNASNMNFNFRPGSAGVDYIFVLTSEGTGWIPPHWAKLVREN